VRARPERHAAVLCRGQLREFLGRQAVVLALHLWRTTAHFGPGSMAGGNGPMERLQWWLLLLSAVMFSMSGCASMREWRLTGLKDWSEHPAHFASAEHMVFSMKSHKTAASITQADMASAEREKWWGRGVPQETATVVSASAPTPMSKRSPGDIAAAGSEATAELEAPGAETLISSEPAEGQAAARVTPRAAAKRDSKRDTRPPDRATDATGDVTGLWRGYWMANGVWGERRESGAEMTFVQTGTNGTAHMKLGDTVAAVGVPEVVRHLGALGTPMKLRVTRKEVLARWENGPAVLVRLTRVGDRMYGRIDASPSFLLVLERQ